MNGMYKNLKPSGYEMRKICDHSVVDVVYRRRRVQDRWSWCVHAYTFLRLPEPNSLCESESDQQLLLLQPVKTRIDPTAYMNLLLMQVQLNQSDCIKYE